MVVNKRRKNSRQRGSWTHGWGAKKKHRGAGHRGGRGMAGSGKRGDTKKPTTSWANKKYFGKFGFKSKNKTIIKAINIAYLEEKIDSLIEQKLAEKKGDTYTIDLSKIKCNKLLGSGKPTKKYQITTEFSSAKAVEKIKTAGGDVSVTSGSNEPEEEFVEESTNDKKPANEA